MRSFLKYVVFLVLPVTLVILWLSGAFHHRIDAKEVEPPTKTVSGIKVASVKVKDRSVLSFTGTIVPSDRAEISTRNMGYVVEVLVKEGDRVKKDQVLLRIDTKDVRAQIESARQGVVQAQKNYEMAKANFEAVKKTYERFKKLLEEKAITQHEFDMIEAKFKSAKAQLESAKAGVEMAKRQLEALQNTLTYTEIKAPFDGFVVSKFVDKGDIARPGYPLLILEKPPYKVEVSLPERLYTQIRVGDKLTVYVPSLKKRLKATVVEKEASVDPMSRTFKVKALLQGDGLKGGFFAKVFVEEKIKKTIVIPQKAIYRRWDFTGVWVVKPDGTLELRFVRTGRKFGNMVEVLSGLKEGEKVVVEGHERVCEGCRVGG